MRKKYMKIVNLLFIIEESIIFMVFYFFYLDSL